VEAVAFDPRLTGRKMIFLAGPRQAGRLAGAPIGRRFLHASVWTGSEMIVFGGRLERISERLDDGGRFRPD
jgi:hypothetical protein